jgi:predicted regulator of Ras-like GTPase activity (Roadblock/LC7/MglB family)
MAERPSQRSKLAAKDTMSSSTNDSGSLNNGGPTGGPQKGDHGGPRPISSLVVGEPDNKRIGIQLDRLLAEAGAGTTLLLDKGGEVIAIRGEELTQDVNMLGALLAGAFATSREIARVMSETNFRSLFQQGMQRNMLTEMVGEGWLVVIMFDKTTHVGLIRDLLRQVTPQLEAVLLQVQRQSRIVSGLNPAFRTSVEDTIDLLFKD